MNIRNCLCLLSLTISSFSSAAEPTATIPPGPKFRIEETLVTYRGTEQQDYLAFPAITKTGENEILMSYKRGEAHARDIGAVLEIIRVDLESGDIVQDPIQLGFPDEIMQMGVDYFPRTRGESTLSSPGVIFTILREMWSLRSELEDIERVC